MSIKNVIVLSQIKPKINPSKMFVIIIIFMNSYKSTHWAISLTVVQCVEDDVYLNLLTNKTIPALNNVMVTTLSPELLCLTEMR